MVSSLEQQCVLGGKGEAGLMDDMGEAREELAVVQDHDCTGEDAIKEGWIGKSL